MQGQDTSFELLLIPAFFLMWLLIWLPLVASLATVLQWWPLRTSTPVQEIPLLISLYLLAPCILLAVVPPHKNFWVVYGLAKSQAVLTSLALGIGLAVVGLIMMLLLQQWLQWGQLNLNKLNLNDKNIPHHHLGTALLLALSLGIGVGLVEELVFRGFLINQLQQISPFLLASAIASIIFAVLHMLWKGTDIIPQLPGLWLLGMVLSVARWVDNGNLGLAWGLHAGWIWGIATLDITQLWTRSSNSPRWMRGREGQPLTGGIDYLFLLLTAILLIAGRSFISM
jgi:membrane protease YdiL (CAAX protease family)